MSQNTRTQNGGQEGDPRRNNPPQYNFRPLLPKVEEQEDDEPPPVARRRAARHQPHRETRTKRLEQRVDMLTELVNTLVTALGQNTANVTLVIPPRLNILKRAEMPRQARPKPTLVRVGVALGIDAIALQGAKIKKLPQSCVGLSNLGTLYSIGSSEQWLTQTWMMNMTLNKSVQLALGSAPTCILGWTPKGRGESNRPRTSPLSEQHVTSNSSHN